MRGFLGLDAFATDVDSAIAQADRVAAGPRPAVQRPVSATTQRDAVQGFADSALGRSIKSFGGLIVGIGLLLLIKALIWGGVDAVSGSDDEDAAVYESAASEVEDAAEIPTDEALGAYASDDPANEADGYVDETASTYAEPAPVGETASLPSPGSYQLTRSELRYCMQENLRLEGEKSEMESLQYTDTDRFNSNVDAFNSRIDDLQSRCNGRYLVSDESSINQELFTQRYSLQREGRDRVQ